MRVLFFLLSVLLLASCGPMTASQPQATSTPQAMPATWTPAPSPTAAPTFTDIPTYTAVPVISPPASPTMDFLAALRGRFQDSLPSPGERWIAERESKKLLVKSQTGRRVWTLPCELFDDCSTVFPVRWSDDGSILYFAPAPTTGGAPDSILPVTALAQIDVNTGRWESLLPESGHYYDFTFSPNEDYIAYTESSGWDTEEPTVTVGIFRMKNKKMQQQHTLDENYAGDIVWSPFKTRIIFQTRGEKGSSVVFYDLETNVLKYVVSNEQADLDLSIWNDADNTVALEQKDWLTRRRSYWFLNPFSGELTPASITATPTP